MNKIILYIAQSIDGYIATPDGEVKWLDEFSGTGEDYGYTEFVKSIDSNIQGANTYKQVLNFDIPWPYKSKSYVITNQKLNKPKDADIEFMSGDLKKVVKEIKNNSQKDIWLIGGATLTQSFLKESFLDKMIIFTMPTFLGSGISLFGDNGSQVELVLNTSKKYKSGVVENHYTFKFD